MRCILWCIPWRKCNNVEVVRDPAVTHNYEDLAHMNKSRSFPYDVLYQATDSFSNSAKIGEGEFGDVYRAELQNPNRVVAVKKLKARIQEQSKKEFIQEIANSEPLMHRNLIQLIGYSYEPQMGVLLIVFEFMSNGTLQEHLFGNNSSDPLSWEHRYSIARGLASGVEYLHKGCNKCLIHRDIKPGNVLLDGDFRPKLGDFGLARLTDHGKSMSTTAQGGTYGYMAPEVALSGQKANIESDVFSFGIVALEIATGRKPSEEEQGRLLPLVSRVWDLNNKGCILDAVDKRLGTEFNRDEANRLLIVGLLCCQRSSKRPKMGRVISLLKGYRLISCEKVEPLEGYYKDALNRSSSSNTQGISHSISLQDSSSSSSTQYYTPDQSESEMDSSPLRPTSRHPRKFTPGINEGLPNIEE